MSGGLLGDGAAGFVTAALCLTIIESILLMANQISQRQVLVGAIAVLAAAGLACSSLSIAVPAQSDRTVIENESPGVGPTWPPTWTPTWTPTPSPTSLPTAIPTATPTIDAVSTSVAPTTASPMFDFPVSDPDDLEVGLPEVTCEPGEDALIEASQDCSPASMTCSATVNVFGMLVTSQISYEIQGMEGEQCVLYVRMDEMRVGFSEELVQLLLEDEGATSEDIRRMEEEANEELVQFQGRDGVCRFGSTEDLTTWLGTLKGGASYGYSGACELVDGEWRCEGDEETPECEGELFEPLSEE